MKVFSVYDSKAEAYILPFYERTTGLAIRAFSNAANEPEHGFCKNPADYTLMEVGEWNEMEGRFEPLHANKNLGTALEMKSATVANATTDGSREERMKLETDFNEGEN